MTQEVRATALFVCGINPHVVTKIESVHSTRIGSSFAPCIYGKARLPDGVRECEVDFPIFIADADSREKLEEVRAIFHSRVDKAFDAYLANWEEIARRIEQAGKPRTIKEALKDVSDKKKEAGNGDVSGMDSGA